MFTAVVLRGFGAVENEGGLGVGAVVSAPTNVVVALTLEVAVTTLFWFRAIAENEYGVSAVRPVSESVVSCASVSHTGVADGVPSLATYLAFHVPSVEVAYMAKSVAGFDVGLPFSLLVSVSEVAVTLPSVGAEGVFAYV
jgi:hypothetical protein